MRVGFRPVTLADLGMLRDWIARPHWQDWWGDPDEEVGHIRDMVEGRDTTRPYLIVIDGLPVGYIQCWLVQDQLKTCGTTHPWLAALPLEGVGVDLSLADAGKLGQGIGTTALRAFLQMLEDEGHRVIVIDPDRSNGRAVRAYEKAGFRPVAALEGRTGDVLIMQYQTRGGGTP